MLNNVFSSFGASICRTKSNSSSSEQSPSTKRKWRAENHRSVGENAWRLIHQLHGLLIIIIGLVNICLGVFLAVLPLPVWVVWYVYFGILVIVIFAVEILACRRNYGNKKSYVNTLSSKIILINKNGRFYSCSYR